MQTGQSSQSSYNYLIAHLHHLKDDVSKEIVKYHKLTGGKESKLDKAYANGFKEVIERNIGKGTITALSRALRIVVPLIQFGSGAYVAIASANLLPSAKHKSKKNSSQDESEKPNLKIENLPQSRL